MPMVWDEQAGAMVWEDEATTLSSQPVTVPDDAQLGQPGIMGALRRVFGGDENLNPPAEGLGIDRSALSSALLPLGGSMIGARLGAKALGKAGDYLGQAIGGAAGQAANYATGIDPTPETAGQAALEMGLAALPGPASKAAVATTKYPSFLARQISNWKPYLGVGLGEEAYNMSKGAVGKIDPGQAAVTAAYDKVRNNPAYKAMGAPTTTTVTGTPPGSLFSNPATTTITTKNYPIKLPEALRVSAEEATKYGEASRLAPGLADNYTARITKLSTEGGTFENVHQLLRDLNDDIRNPGTASPSEIRVLKDFKTAIWNDLSNHAITPDLQAANKIFSRHEAAKELEQAVTSTRIQRGEIKAIPNIGTVVKKMEDIYLDPDNHFIRSAVPAQEFQSMIDDFMKLGIEQEQTKSNVGSLAIHGAAAGTAGSVGQSVGGAKGALVGSVAGLTGLRGAMERMTKRSLQKTEGAPYRAKALATFRSQPKPMNINPKAGEALGQAGVQSLSDAFLRQRGIDPVTMQPLEEGQ